MRYEVTLVAPNNKNEIIERIHMKSIAKPSNRFVRVTRTMCEVYHTALREEARVYHFHDPELILIGVLLKMHGKKVIYDVHEDLPKQIMSKDWIPKFLRKVIGLLATLMEHIGSSMFDVIIAATPTIAKRFPRRKTITVLNYPLVNELVCTEARPYTERDNIIAYVGGITEIRGAKEMIEAMAFLTSFYEVRLVLAGVISPPGLEEKLKIALAHEYVDFIGYQSREGVRYLLSQARVGLVALHPTTNHLAGYPVKLFEYMAAGIPVVASDFPTCREIVEGEKCGLLVDPLDPKEIADAIRYLLDNPEEAEAMGRRGRQAVLAQYNWENEEPKLLAVYERLLSNKRLLK